MVKAKELDQQWKRWHESEDDEAWDALMEMVEPVVSQARNTYAGGKEDPVIDLKSQELTRRALSTYDPEKGSLKTHLFQQLKPLNQVLHHRANALQIPQRAWWDMQNMQSEREAYREDHGRDPTAQELADRTGLSLRRISSLRQFSREPVPDSALKKEDPDAMLGAHDPGEENRWPGKAVYYSLGPTDQKIMEWRTGIFGSEQLPNKEIAKQLGVSAAAVSQRSAKIAEQLREALEMEGQ